MSKHVLNTRLAARNVSGELPMSSLELMSDVTGAAASVEGRSYV